MSRSKQKKKFHDVYASIKPNDNFGTLFDSMCQSEAYKSLTLGEKQMYTMCRVQAKSPHGRKCLYKHGEEYGRKYDADKYFVFPAEHMAKYNIDRSNGGKWLKQLEEKGFIERVECNKHIQKVNVFAFSNKWENTN